MPLFSILVSELTPEMLSKAEWWKFYSIVGDLWADTRPSKSIVTPESEGYPAISLSTHYYDSVCRCFPVTMSPDGTEVRLECPRMPDEVEIDLPRTNRPVYSVAPINSLSKCWQWIAEHDRLYDTDKIARVSAPSYEHYPRRTCDGVWVWSTRR